MLDAHAYVMQVKLCKANTRGVTDSVPYVQFQSVDDFIPEPRCSKFAVGLQTSRNKKEVLKARSDYEPKGRE